MAVTNMIKIDGLTYTFPHSSQPALSDVSLAVSAGEFVLLAGPSGAGKSTLLRCLNGLVPHFSGGTIAGRVEVGGNSALDSGPRVLSKVVGFVFQSPESQAVLDRVEAEIAFGLENAAIPEAEMRLRVEEVLNLLDLVNLRDRPLTTLSGGERQRVAIATAMVLKPEILVLDEPTSQLDPQAAGELLQSLVRLNEELGLTIVLVEQRLERVVRYVDRLVYLEDGRVIADGPVRQALAQIPDTQLPPLVRLGRAMAWEPLPLTIKEGRKVAGQLKQPMQSGGRQAASGRVRDSSSPLLEAQGIRFAYNGRPVLQGVDLSVRRGEAVVLLGRNGSGKSTLLKCLIGLLRPAQGRIVLDGEPVNGRSVADICRQVAYLPQAPDDLLFADTVEEELAVTLRNHGLTPGQLSLAPSALLVELGLDRLAQAYPRDLSVGQRQRVALASVMVTVPKLLLLDEPTRGLDFSAKRDLIGLWRTWQARGIGLLLVTHDVELAARIADRVMVLGPGQIIADGPPAEVLGASALFAPQMARLFPGRGWLSVEDALAGLAV
jgi:energy-coupling factor transport system ATP-binding protein